MAAITLRPETEDSCASGVASLRVLAVIPGHDSAPGFGFARRQIQSLRREKVSVESFFFDTRKSLFAFVQNCRALSHNVRTLRPDIVHAHYGTMTALACALVVRGPLIVTYRGSDLNPEPGYSWFRTRLAIVSSQLAALRCDHIICVSRQLSERLWWRKNRVSIVPTGVDLQRFVPVERAIARQRLGWDLSIPVVLFNAGRAPAVKGLRLAQEVMTRVSQRRRVRFEVMKGDLAPEIVPLFMSGADCLLVTSESEGSPNVVKEALACSLPVVSVDVGDVQERLNGVWPSRIVNRNPIELANAVLDILKEPTRSNGRTLIAGVADTTVARQLLFIYRSILGRD